jgi:hypothetical protein
LITRIIFGDEYRSLSSHTKTTRRQIAEALALIHPHTLLPVLLSIDTPSHGSCQLTRSKPSVTVVWAVQHSVVTTTEFPTLRSVDTSTSEETALWHKAPYLSYIIFN